MRTGMFTALLPALAVSVCLLAPGPSVAGRPAHFDYPVKLLNLETGYLLGRGGNVQVGFGESGFGVAGRMQFTTNVLFDAVGFVNGQVKLGLLMDGGPVPAVAVGLGYYNLLSSGYILERAVRESFSDDDMDLSSGLEYICFFASASKRLHERIRIHAGFQYRYLEGRLDSDSPFNLTVERDTASVFLSVDQRTDHRSIMGGLDLDALDHLKLILEFGYDLSYGRARAGAGFRLGIMESFSLTLGALLPGIELDEDIGIPVLPHLSILWRF